MNGSNASHSDHQIPLLSVIIPAYNAEPFIGQAIQSVLDQTYSCYEIIVVDDGSTDGTQEVLKTFDRKIQCLYQQNKGPSAARNAGIQSARGEIICFLDADDLWTPEKLEVQIKFMAANSEVALIFSDHEEFNENGTVFSSFLEEKHKTFGVNGIVAEPIDHAFEKLILENFISTPTVMVRKSCLEKVGLFDEKIWSVEDRDLWLRISASFAIACIPKVLCKRRSRQASLSTNKELSLRGKIKVLKKNWKLFPNLAPENLWRSQLADFYGQLGYYLLQDNRRWSSLKVGIIGLKYIIRKGDKGISWNSKPGWMIVALIPASLLGWKLSRYLWQPLK